MQTRFISLFLLLIALSSCQDDAAKREAEMAKENQKREAVFKTVEQNWQFPLRPLNPKAQAIAGGWNEWRLFLSELSQKPKSSIGAFQKKSKALTLRVNALNNPPPLFNRPEIKSRIVALTTMVRSLDLFINLENIPADKVSLRIQEINATLTSLELQMEEIAAAQDVKLERGESEMIRMLDTTRAIPNVKK